MHKEKQKSSLQVLLDGVPDGFLVDHAWLVAHGVDGQLLHDYLAQGYLERIERGVYRRSLPGCSQSFSSLAEVPAGVVMVSLQWVMNYRVHLGGKSALSFRLLRSQKIFVNYFGFYLYGEFPSWLKRVPLRGDFQYRSTSLFGHNTAGIFSGEFRSKFSPWGSPERWPLRISSRERALLELLDELPHRVSFADVDEEFRRLNDLRPDELMNLLHLCRSVKVRRLFCVFAERHQHYWWKKMDPSLIDLGSGPRALPVVPSGSLHPKYDIMVPEKLIHLKDSKEVEYA